MRTSLQTLRRIFGNFPITRFSDYPIISGCPGARFSPRSPLCAGASPLFGNHHGAVLAARATDPNRQIALALFYVMRQQEREQIGDPVQRFLRLGERTNVLRHLWMRPVSGRNSGMKCGFGRKRTSKTRSASSGTPSRNPKLTTETMMLFCFDSWRKRSLINDRSSCTLNFEVSMSSSASVEIGCQTLALGLHRRTNRRMRRPCGCGRRVSL